MKFLLICLLALPLHAATNIEKEIDAIVAALTSHKRMEYLIADLFNDVAEERQKKIDEENVAELVFRLKGEMRGDEFMSALYPFFQSNFTNKEIRKLRAIYEDTAFIKMQEKTMEFSGILVLAIRNKVVEMVDEFESEPVILTDPRVFHLDSQNFFTEVVQSKGFVIVDVYADWCSPCKKLSPIFEAVSMGYPQIKFMKMNWEEGKDILKSLGVNLLPTILFFKDGEVVGKQVGFLEAQDLKAKIEEIFQVLAK